MFWEMFWFDVEKVVDKILILYKCIFNDIIIWYIKVEKNGKIYINKGVVVWG